MKKARADFETLLRLYRSRQLTAKENAALVRAINTLGAALGIKDWDWGT